MDNSVDAIARDAIEKGYCSYCGQKVGDNNLTQIHLRVHDNEIIQEWKKNLGHEDDDTSIDIRASAMEPKGAGALIYSDGKDSLVLTKEELKVLRDFLNLEDNDDWTPLINAACFAKEDLLKILIKIGVDINTQNSRGETALSVARWNQKRKHISDDERESTDEIIKILIEYGAKE